MRPTPVVRTVSATEAKSRFGEIIKRAYAQDEHLIVEKGGIPVVAIIPMADYQQLLDTPTAEPEVVRQVASASRREAANRQLGEVLARVHARQPRVDEDVAEKLILNETMAVKRARAKKMLAAGSRSRRGEARKS